MTDKVEMLDQTVTVEELIAVLGRFNPEAVVTLSLDGSASFAEDGLTVEEIDTFPPEVMLSADL